MTKLKAANIDNEMIKKTDDVVTITLFKNILGKETFNLSSA